MALSGLLGALGGVAKAAGAPSAVVLSLAIAVALGAASVLVLHLLERRAEGREAGAQVSPVPRSTLLAGPENFVNRAEEMEHLNALLDRSRSAGRVITGVITGLPGVGKSAVGKHWVETVREQFPGGDLFGDFSRRRRGSKVDVNGVLGDFIRELSGEGVVLPAKTDERVAMFKRLSYGRRLLVLLDDVTEPAQVEQLRPTGPGSVVIATSYKELEALHYDGAALVEVPPMEEKHALELLVERAGPHGWRFRREGEEAKRLLRLCDGLSLPLCVCGARMLLGGRSLTVAEMVTEIADEKRRLEVLSGKGEYAGSAVFGFAYADLTGKTRLVYRRLSLHPGVSLDSVHAELLSGLAGEEVHEQLEALVETNLLERAGNGRYRFHSLVRRHAGERAEQEELDRRRETLERRLVDWYRAAIARADRAIVPNRLRLAPEATDPPGLLPVFDSRSAAFDWLENERPNMLPVLKMATEREWDAPVWQVAEALWPFHHNRRHYADWIDVTTLGVESARRDREVEAEARLCTQRARAFVDLGDFDRARGDLEHADRITRDSPNIRLRGSIREFTGVCHLAEGDDERALAAFRQAREAFTGLSNERGVAIQDYFIGRVLVQQGHSDEAVRVLGSALTTMESLRDQLFVGRLHLRLGQALRRAGRLHEAEPVLEDGLKILSQLGMRLEEAESHEELAMIAEAEGETRKAGRQREAALNIYREIGHPRAGEMAAAASGRPLGAALD